MSESRFENSPRNQRLVHITREDGEIVEVSTEQIVPCDATLHMNGEFIGTVSELKIELPVWKKDACR